MVSQKIVDNHVVARVSELSQSDIQSKTLWLPPYSKPAPDWIPTGARVVQARSLLADSLKTQIFVGTRCEKQGSGMVKGEATSSANTCTLQALEDSEFDLSVQVKGY